jgi:hypothetical protein
MVLPSLMTLLPYLDMRRAGAVRISGWLCVEFLMINNNFKMSLFKTIHTHTSSLLSQIVALVMFLSLIDFAPPTSFESGLMFCFSFSFLVSRGT